MHRAGTSLTAAMLRALGVRLSGDLMPPTPDNPIGYFESLEIVGLHDAVLNALGGRTWRTNSSMVLFPDDWASSPQIAPLRERLKQVAATEIGASPQVWGFKDPRTAQLLPLWREIAQELQAEMRFVVVLRHPREVSESLRARDGMHPVRGEILWVEHYLDALLHTTPASRTFISYDAWFTDPVGTAQALARNLELPVPDEQGVRELLATLVSPSLRHHKTADDVPGYLPFTRDLYMAMLQGNEAMLQTMVPLLHLRRIFSANVVACAMDTRDQTDFSMRK